jgi:hypothetical protein
LGSDDDDEDFDEDGPHGFQAGPPRVRHFPASAT